MTNSMFSPNYCLVETARGLPLNIFQQGIQTLQIPVNTERGF